LLKRDIESAIIIEISTVTTIPRIYARIIWCTLVVQSHT
jgi:hypothetical protein